MARHKRYPLDQSPLYHLQRKKKLAEVLNISSKELRALSRSEGLYREWDEPKNNGKGYRHIENPRGDLKRVQARITKILSKIEPPSFLFCPVKGKSYVDNAAMHYGQHDIRCLDIKNYFESTRAERVKWFFHFVMKCSRDVAILLMKLLTINGHLPTGAPSSPIMAFYAHYDVWSSVYALTQASDIKLSVYIDDMTVSGYHVPERIWWELKKVIHGSGLRYHKEKIFVDRPADITGVIVKDDEILLPNRGHLKRWIARREYAAARADGDQHLIEKSLRRLSGLAGQEKQFHGRASSSPAIS